MKEIITAKPDVKRFIYAFLFFNLALLVGLSIKYGFSNIASDTGAMSALVLFPPVLITCCDSLLLNKICKNQFLKHIGQISTHFFFWHIPTFSVFKIIIIRSKIVLTPDNGWLLMVMYFIMLICVSELSKVAMDSYKTKGYSFGSNRNQEEK